MTGAQLPEELARIERALARRPLQQPPAGLRLRALGEVRRARARERSLLLATAAAAVIAVATIGLSQPVSARATRLDAAGLVRSEAQALERLGYAPRDARRLAFVAHAVDLRRLAPPMGSGAAAFLTDGGL